MKIEHVMIYLIFGGALAGLVDRLLVVECNKHLTQDKVAYIATLWPAFVTAAFITKKTGEPFCDIDEAKTNNQTSD